MKVERTVMPAVLNVDTAVRGYHVYRTVWDPSPAECFVVLHQPDNDHDRHAMAVYGMDEPGQIVGHLPHEISRISHYFTRHDGKIMGEVTGSRRYCREVGGTEIPCVLQFSGTPRNVQILRRAIEELVLSTVTVL